MNVHITKFSTEAEYLAQKELLTPPNVSLVMDTGNVFYIPEIQPPSSWLWEDNEHILWDDGTEMIY